MQHHTTTLEEAARRLGTTSLNTLMQIKRGYLEALEVDGTWQVNTQSLEALLATPGPRKTAAVCTKKHGCGGCGGDGV